MSETMPETLRETLRETRGEPMPSLAAPVAPSEAPTTYVVGGWRIFQITDGSATFGWAALTPEDARAAHIEMLGADEPEQCEVEPVDAATVQTVHWGDMSDAVNLSPPGVTITERSDGRILTTTTAADWARFEEAQPRPHGLRGQNVWGSEW